MKEPPSHIHSSRVLFPLGLGTALSLMGDATLYTVLPTHAADAGIALSAVGIILSVNRGIRLLLNSLAGLAYDRWPRRRLFVVALFVGALSTAVYAATRGFWPLLTGRLLWGLAWSGIWVGGATMILDTAGERDRGRWTGLYQTWFFLGGAVGALGGGLLTDLIGYTNTMWIAAGLTAIGGLGALLMLPETQGTRRSVDSSAPIPGSAGQRAMRPRADGRLWLTVSIHGLSRFVMSGVVSATLGLLVRDHLPWGSRALGVATLTGILMASRTVLSMLAAPLSGMLSDRLGGRWAVVSLGLALGLIGMLLTAWHVPASILAGVLIAAGARGSLQSLVTSLTGDLVAQGQRGSAVGMLHTAGDLGSAIGPWLAYALLPWIGLSGLYLACAALFAIALLGNVFLLRRQSPTPAG